MIYEIEPSLILKATSTHRCGEASCDWWIFTATLLSRSGHKNSQDQVISTYAKIFVDRSPSRHYRGDPTHQTGQLSGPVP